MKKILLIITTVFLLVGCTELIDISPTNKGNVETPPGVSDGVIPDPNIGSITTLGAGSVSVPAYTDDVLSGILYYTPEVAGQTNTSKSINITTTGTPIQHRNNKSITSDNNSEISGDFHNALRDREQELLINGLEQNSSNLKVRKAPSSVNVGDKWRNIKVDSALNGNYLPIDATCVAISQYGNFYIEDNLTITDEITVLLEDYKNELDKMYPIIHGYFGRENDTDDNGKINILFFRSESAGLSGYFDGTDKYPVTTYSRSNEADVLYLNFRIINKKYDVLSTIAHEFQHMVLFDNRYNQNRKNLDTWVNEGLSMQAEYITGYYDKQTSDYLAGFLHGYHSLSLTNWTSANYGYSMVYIRYLTERFGDSIVKALYRSTYTNGIYAVEDATGKGFNDIFKNFAFTLFVAGKGITDDPEYNIRSLPTPFKFRYSELDAGEGGRIVLLPYSMRYINFYGKVDSITLSDGGKGFIVTE